MKKMVLKSEKILKIIDSGNYKSIKSTDLDNLVETLTIVLDKDIEMMPILSDVRYDNNNNISNSPYDFTVIEILDSKNTIKKRNFESIKVKFLIDLNKNYENLD